MKINELKNENNKIHLELILDMSEFDAYFIRCADCQEILLKENAIEIDGDYYCSDCITECDACGCIHPIEESYRVVDSDYRYCRDCYENNTYICNDCGYHFRYSDSLTQVDDGSYCDNCIDNHRSPIESYHTFKDHGEIRFYGNENRSQTPYIGFELEVDTDHRINRNAVIDRFEADFGDFLHYEEDGSLRYGWENISQPASLSYHLEMMDKYNNMFDILKSEDIRSHDTTSCGFHIHIDRAFFENKQDSATSKLLYLFEKFRAELMIFSRRNNEQADNWARSRKYNSANKGWIKRAVKDSKCYHNHSDRYYSVNLTNSETIEIRLWKGTLNIETFEATLKFTVRLAELCKRISAVELSKMTFEDLLGSDEVILSYWDRIKNN